MLDHVNEISKDNYTCKYYDHSNIDRLVKSHHESALKVIHLNCSSIVKHGLDLVGYLAQTPGKTSYEYSEIHVFSG